MKKIIFFLFFFASKSYSACSLDFGIEEERFRNAPSSSQIQNISICKRNNGSRFIEFTQNSRTWIEEVFYMNRLHYPHTGPVRQFITGIQQSFLTQRNTRILAIYDNQATLVLPVDAPGKAGNEYLIKY